MLIQIVGFNMLEDSWLEDRGVNRLPLLKKLTE
jgi:hypothetical protein